MTGVPPGLPDFPDSLLDMLMSAFGVPWEMGAKRALIEDFSPTWADPATTPAQNGVPCGAPDLPVHVCVVLPNKVVLGAIKEEHPLSGCLIKLEPAQRLHKFSVGDSTAPGVSRARFSTEPGPGPAARGSPTSTGPGPVARGSPTSTVPGAAASRAWAAFARAGSSTARTGAGLAPSSSTPTSWLRSCVTRGVCVGLAWPCGERRLEVWRLIFTGPQVMSRLVLGAAKAMPAHQVLPSVKAQVTVQHDQCKY
jgi:hypothetical protein